jgi:hypothetical protein
MWVPYHRGSNLIGLPTLPVPTMRAALWRVVAPMSGTTKRGTDAKMAVSSGEFVITVDSTSTAKVQMDDDPGEVLNGNSITEYWIEFTVEFSNVGYLGADNITILDSSGDVALKLMQTGGTIDQLRMTYLHDAGNTSDAIAYTPSASTPDTIRLQYKVDSDGGADVANNGVASFWIVGGDSSTNTTVDNDSKGNPERVTFGLDSNAYNGSNSFTITYDNYKFYTSDPGVVICCDIS